MLLTINERRSKITRNSVFNCHLLPVGRQMAIKNTVSRDFWSAFAIVKSRFDCRLSSVIFLRLPHSLDLNQCLKVSNPELRHQLWGRSRAFIFAIILLNV